MVNRHPSLASRHSGFVQLDGGSRPDIAMADADIPLTAIRSYASSTGARRPGTSTGQNHPSDPASHDSNENEKHHHHLHHRHAGRRRKLGHGGLGRKGTGGSDEVQMNALGRLYEKIVGFSTVTRYMVYVVPVGLLLAVPLIVLPATGNRYNINVGKHVEGAETDADGNTKEGGKTVTSGPTLFNLFLWIEISWLSLWAAKIVAWLLPRAFMFLCGIVSAGVRKYATVLQNLTITLSLFFWALASWFSFKGLFNWANNRGAVVWVHNLERVLGAIFAASAVLLVEKAIVQLIGVTYHQRSFALRIKQSKREVRLLGMLYEASRTLFPTYCREFAEEDYVISDSIEMMLSKGHKRTGSATPMKFIGDVGRIGGKVTHAFGNLASEITGKQVFNPNSAHSVVIEALEKQLPSEALARRIWMSFVVEGKDALYMEDFHEVLGESYASEAEEAFNVIDADLNGDISLDEMVRKTVEIGKERKAITEGMKDIGQALRVLDKVLMFIVLLITVFIFLAFFRSNLVTVIASAGTALLSLSFVFAVTTQEFLGSCIFLFVKHPYDVGDRVDINGSQMVVERISLLYSVFKRIDRNQVVQVPNIQLNNLWIDNVSRSGSMVECLDIDVSYDTTFEDIELLRLEMEKFVRAPENSRDFQPDFSIGVGSVGNLDKMTLQICMQHKSNWHNDTVRSTRRSKFMCALAVALKKIPIYGPGGGGEALGGPTNPTYSVSVTDEFAASSRADAAKAKEDSRMIPTNPGQTAREAAEAEQQAISELNTRPLDIDTFTSTWDTRDDHTISSRDNNLPDDPRRSREIENIRSDLAKKESQRGRRKAGEGLSALSPTDSNQQGFPPSARSPRLETFDEEANTGMPRSRPSQASGRVPSVRGEEEGRSSFALSARGYLSGRSRSRGGPSSGAHQ